MVMRPTLHSRAFRARARVITPPGRGTSSDALIQPYSGHASRTSLEIYSRLALADAQSSYDDIIDQFPV